MAFIQHISCPKCNSRDNLAEYSDGFYCFGCGYRKSKNDLESIRGRLSESEVPTMRSNENLIYTTDDIPQRAMQWLLKYGLTKDDIDTYKISWNPAWHALVLVNIPGYWQGRNFADPDRTCGAKYLSKGRKPLIFYGNGDILVCVEDVISAIKISKANKDVIVTPLLGSSMSLEHIETILERYKNVRIWLDRDKAIEAVKMARNLKQSGINAEAIITPNDPKDYSTGEINAWLKNK